MAFEFLKPENNYKAQSGELPTFGRGSNVFQYPTLATTGANDYPSIECINLGCITICDLKSSC